MEIGQECLQQVILSTEIGQECLQQVILSTEIGQECLQHIILLVRSPKIWYDLPRCGTSTLYLPSSPKDMFIGLPLIKPRQHVVCSLWDESIVAKIRCSQMTWSSFPGEQLSMAQYFTAGGRINLAKGLSWPFLSHLSSKRKHQGGLPPPSLVTLWGFQRELEMHSAPTILGFSMVLSIAEMEPSCPRDKMTSTWSILK